MRPEAPFAELEARDLRYSVRLGCSEEERARAQEVGVSLWFRFAAVPLGDDLAATICFAEAGEALGRHFAAREFRLIERMATEAYSVVKELARGKAEVAVRVHKLRPPVKNLAGGALFTFGDFRP